MSKNTRYRHSIDDKNTMYSQNLIHWLAVEFSWLKGKPERKTIFMERLVFFSKCMVSSSLTSYMTYKAHQSRYHHHFWRLYRFIVICAATIFTTRRTTEILIFLQSGVFIETTWTFVVYIPIIILSHATSPDFKWRQNTDLEVWPLSHF